MTKPKHTNKAETDVAEVAAPVLYLITVSTRAEYRTSTFMPGQSYRVNEAAKEALGGAIATSTKIA